MNGLSRRLSRTLKRTGTLLTALFMALGAASTNALEYQLETVAEGLDHPWGLAELPDGDLLITERPGNLKRVTAGGSVSSIDNVPAVFFAGQGGLFDVLPAPDFAATGILSGLRGR